MAVAGREVWPEPENLDYDRPAVPKLDPELLPGAMKPFAEDIAHRMQVPIEYPAILPTAA